MFIQRELIQQIITLFKEEPYYRDDEHATIDYIVNKYYKKDFGKNVMATAKFIFTLSRQFRLIQQKVPSLRGARWIDRQRKGGEISKAHYEAIMGELYELRGICQQMKMAFDESDYFDMDDFENEEPQSD